MKIMRTQLASFVAVLALASTLRAADPQLPIADGPFQPTDESLQQYRCPEWFRDAKLGIWSHWGPVAEPGGFGGNWYARQIYVQGTREYIHHVKTYGHPSKFGYKDIIELWKADKFDPDRLMELYVKAGAKYFVSMGAHHDNFDLWNSKHQEWNVVNHGPKKDIVGLWRDAALKRGLRFGVSEHFARSYNWMQRSHGSDTNGPMAGVPYDGADPKIARLYGPPHGDTSPGYPANPPETWTREWFNRMQDLVHSYQPDLVYSDGGIPFGEVGRSFMADFYNRNLKAHGGKLEAVYNIKKGRGIGEYVEGAAIQDEENTVLAGIKDQPWQTDASIGTWFFVRDLEPKWRRSGPDVIVMLADIVAKNGNLLLNIPQRGDGTIDAEAERVLADLAAWMKVNGEAIFATRPWKILGEGPALSSKSRGIRRAADYTVEDIRFTRSKDGATLYAIALGTPADGKLAVRSLASAAGQIDEVSLLGHSGKLDWRQSAGGLEVTLPVKKPCTTAYALKVSAGDLKPVPVVYDNAMAADANGCILLAAAKARVHGTTPKYEHSGAKDQIGYWNSAADFVSWNIKVKKPGTYAVELAYSCTTSGSAFTVEVGGQKLSGTSTSTGAWDTYRTDSLGVLTIDKSGNHELAVKPKSPPKWNSIGLKSIILKPVE
jgi:alpha-L-fucosidase